MIRRKFDMSVKIMLADDHILVREGIKCLLECDNNVEVIAEANDGLECMKKLEYMNPDVLLLDLSMPNMDGLEVLKELKRKKCSVKVLVLTVHGEGEYFIKAINNGADGYILKNSDARELKQAINIILKGESYVQSCLLPILKSDMNDNRDDKEKLELLTKRENEILIQIADGMLNKEIADHLNISERTVKNHISNIFKKLNVSDRTQAAVFAIKNHIVNLF